MIRTLPLLLLLAAVGLRAENSDPLAHLRPGHPRLLFTDGQLASALGAAKTDPLRASLHQHIIATAESILAAPALRQNDGRAVQEQQRYAVYNILTCAMAYRLTGDARFAARVRRDLLTVCAFSEWDRSPDLGTGEMSFAVAVGYDWLYPQLGPRERAAVRRGLLDKALAPADEGFRRGAPWTVRAGNHNQVCNAGLISAALVLADEQPELARRVILGARASLPHALSAYAPDGSYPEGPGYWSYGTTYTAIAVAELEGALGTDLGLSASPGFARTIAFYEAVQGPTGLPFNYADSTDDPQNSPARAWLAERYHDPYALRRTRALLAAALGRGKVIPFDREVQGLVINRFFALHAVWFPAEPAPSDALAPPPLDSHFAGVADIATFRSAWDDPRALFVGFKAGENGISHSHLDLGSFVLEADGERWAVDLGPENDRGTYTLPGYFDTRGRRWTYFRANNLGHNTATPGQAMQLRQIAAPILAFASTPARAFAVADLSALYPDGAAFLLRGVALLDRARVLVQDEYQPRRPDVPLRWAMITRARAEISADGRTVRLAQGGRSLRLDLLAPAAARWFAGPATPPTAGETQNEGCTLLSTEAGPAEGTSPVRLAVLLTPVGDNWRSLPPPRLVPLGDWR